MDEQRFEDLYRSAVRYRKASPQLKALLRDVYDGVVNRPPDLAGLKNALVSLLEFLCTSGGRTDANCCTTDALCSAVDEWERSWSDLPADFRSILDDLGGVLHDAVYAPQIARAFESLPEQLLERVRGLL